MGEFELIERFFKRPASPGGPAISLGIGDDCALLQPTPNTQLAVSSDMLVEGRHFFPDVDPAALGHKALAVNLSDLAACGAKPVAFTLALAMPDAREAWLEPFARGLLALADEHHCALIGGDTTRGPLNICITVFGEIPIVNGKSQALLRSGARPGDDIYVSATLGEARLALEVLRGTVSVPAEVFAQARLRLERPTPRVALGMALRGVATAAIDISDGLMGDLGHLLEASGAGATVQIDNTITLIANYLYRTWEKGIFDGYFSKKQALAYVLAGGDDYELAFTAPASHRSAVQAAAASVGVKATRIGRIDPQPGIRLVDAQGNVRPGHPASFDHFA